MVLAPTEIGIVEHLVGSIVIGAMAPKVIALPTGIGQLVPPPGPVDIPSGELPAHSSSVVFEAFMKGEWRDITGLVVSAGWYHGSQLPNRIGGMLDPAAGNLILENTDGWFNPFNPHPLIDPGPGVPVRITDDTGRQFTGYSAGVQDAAGNVDVYVATMPLYGTIQRLDQFSEGFFARVDGQPTPDQVFLTILQNVEFRGTARVQPSVMKLHGFLLNQRGILGQGRRRTNFRSAIHTLAVLEGGRVYDDREGALVFANFQSRFVQPTSTKIKRITEPFYVRVLEPGRLVVNTIEARSNAFASQGTNILQFTETLPLTIVIPPGTTDVGIELTLLNRDTDFIESYAPLVRGVHYDWSLEVSEGEPISPTFIGYETGLTVFFPNPTNQQQTATLRRVDGEVFKRGFGVRLAVRSGGSVGTYGPETVEYPAELIVDQDEAYSRALHWVRQYDGIGEDGDKAPILAVEVTVREWGGLPFDVDDLVFLDWRTENATALNNWPFWVDRVQHTFANEGPVHDIKLTMVDAWQRGRVLNEALLGTIVVDPTAQEHPLGFIVIVEQGVERQLGQISVGVLIGSVSVETLIGTIGVDTFLGAINVEALIASISVEVQVGSIGVENPLGGVGVENQIGTLAVENLLGFIDVVRLLLQVRPEHQIGTLVVEHQLGGFTVLRRLIQVYPEHQIGTLAVEHQLGGFTTLRRLLRVNPERFIGSLTGFPQELIKTETLIGFIIVTGRPLPVPVTGLTFAGPLRGTNPTYQLSVTVTPNNPRVASFLVSVSFTPTDGTTLRTSAPSRVRGGTQTISIRLFLPAGTTSGTLVLSNSELGLTVANVISVVT